MYLSNPYNISKVYKTGHDVYTYRIQEKKNVFDVTACPALKKIIPSAREMNPSGWPVQNLTLRPLFGRDSFQEGVHAAAGGGQGQELVEVEGEVRPEPLDMRFPSKGVKRQITYLVLFPLIFPMWLTLPDTRAESGKCSGRRLTRGTPISGWSQWWAATVPDRGGRAWGRAPRFVLAWFVSRKIYLHLFLAHNHSLMAYPSWYEKDFRYHTCNTPNAVEDFHFYHILKR